MTLDYSNFYHPAGCGYPATPANGSIIRFESAAVGSQLLSFAILQVTKAGCGGLGTRLCLHVYFI